MTKSLKVGIFSNTLIHGFGQKLAIFPFFFIFVKLGPENVFYGILERKRPSRLQQQEIQKVEKVGFFPRG